MAVNGIEDAPSVLHYLNYLVRPILATCVPLFFFANGFLLISKPLDIKAHILKCIRLIVLTGIWAVINLLLMMPIREEWFSLGLYAFIVMSLCLLISVLLKKIPIINKLLN